MYLYHYTSLEAAINIIGNGLCFWGFRYDCMNDPTDFIFARDKILPSLLQNMSNEEQNEATNFYPYILSFCEESDFDVMWRLYNAEIAIVIDSQKLPFEKWDKMTDVGRRIFYNHVRYADNDTIQSEVDYLWSNRSTNFYTTSYDEHMVFVFPFIKHNAYKIEKEFRLVKFDYDSFYCQYSPKSKDKCEIIEGEIPHDVKCLGSKDGILRLYKEFHLPKDSLVKLILHTYEEEKYKIQEQHLKIWLLQNGFNLNNISIEKTKAWPVR